MLFVSVALLSHANPSVSLPKSPINKVFLYLTHKAWLFLAKMSCCFPTRNALRSHPWEEMLKILWPSGVPICSWLIFKTFLFCFTTAHEASEKIVEALNRCSSALTPGSSTSGCGGGGRWFACGVYIILSGMHPVPLQRMCFGVLCKAARHDSE